MRRRGELPAARPARRRSAARAAEAGLRRDLVEVCRRLHGRHLIGAGEGNVSCRLGEDRLLVTPSGVGKGYLGPGDLLVVDLSGERVRGRGRPSTELGMHLAAYAARPDAGAVVHAHPLTAVAFTVAGVAPPNDLLPEAVLVLGEVPLAPYATPGTPAVAESLRSLWAGHEVFLLERHGALALGRELFQALDRVETLERVCEVALKARLLGRSEPLSAESVARVLAAAGAAARPR